MLRLTTTLSFVWKDTPSKGTEETCTLVGCFTLASTKNRVMRTVRVILRGNIAGIFSQLVRSRTRRDRRGLSTFLNILLTQGIIFTTSIGSQMSLVVDIIKSKHYHTSRRTHIGSINPVTANSKFFSLKGSTTLSTSAALFSRESLFALLEDSVRLPHHTQHFSQAHQS